jgi:thiamine kinase-like enzyme
MQGRPMITKDLISHQYDIAIIRKIAYVHSLDIPFPKNDDWLMRMYRVFAPNLEDIPPLSASVLDHQLVGPLAQQVHEFPALDELNWFMECSKGVLSSLVFSHNDITRANILILEQMDEDCPDQMATDEQVMLIDFGDSYYNHRGYDLACFMRCLSADYDLRDDERYDPYVQSSDQIRMLLRLYLNQRNIPDTSDQLEQLEFEVEFFTLLSDLLSIFYIMLANNRRNLCVEKWVTIYSFTVRIRLRLKIQLITSLLFLF